MENRKEIEEFVRVNEKMNSSLVTDWSKKMILDTIEIYNQEKLEELDEQKKSNKNKNETIKLYYHKTDGGAEYLFDTFIKCKDGGNEGIINNKTKYIVRIDGDIMKDVELTISKN